MLIGFEAGKAKKNQATFINTSNLPVVTIIFLHLPVRCCS